MNNQKTIPSAIVSLILGIVSIFCIGAAAPPMDKSLDNKGGSLNSQITDKHNEANLTKNSLSGKVKWKIERRGPIFDLIIYDDILYFVGFDTNPHLFAINKYNGNELWRFRLDKGQEYRIVVSGGFIYCEIYDNKDPIVYTIAANNISAKDGEEISRIKFSEITNKPNDSISSLAASYGTLYIGTFDGYLYAIEARGKEKKWTFHKSTDKGWIHVGLYNEIIYVGCSLSDFYAIDSKTGQEKWSYKAKTRTETGMPPAINEGFLFFTTSDNWENKIGYLYALDAETGNEKWVYNKIGPFPKPPVVSSNIIYIASQSGNSYDEHKNVTLGYLYAIDINTLEERWRYETKSPIIYSPITDGEVVCIRTTECIYTLDAKTGQEKWHFEKYLNGPAAISNGIVYFSKNEDLYAVHE